MKVRKTISSTVLALLIVLSPVSADGLPVSLGNLEIGLESYDGYQEGLAYLSTDPEGRALEVLIAYRGFGLDDVVWRFGEEDFGALRDAAAQAAWWRSRLLEIDVDQEVLRDVATVGPELTYNYRGTSFPVEAGENSLRFLRQGREYALTLSESTPGADTRRSGEKTLPVFTIHFLGKELPVLRDMISEAGVAAILAAYAEQRAAIDAILDGIPE